MFLQTWLLYMKGKMFTEVANVHTQLRNNDDNIFNITRHPNLARGSYFEWC